jgi:hypothetical protein
LTRLRTTDKLSRGMMRLTIPNEEIKEIFIEKIQKWFGEKVKSSNRDDLAALQKAFLDGDCETIEEILNLQLRTTISYFDAHEGYYHGFLAGLLKGCDSWGVGSNRESGDGRSDILVVTEDRSMGIVIEIKHAHDLDDISTMCKEAMQQMDEKNYSDGFLERGVSQARLYGIAFWKKYCGVMGKSVEVRRARRR